MTDDVGSVVRFAVVGTRPPKQGSPPEAFEAYRVNVLLRVDAKVEHLVLLYPKLEIVSGGGAGVDRRAIENAKRLGVPFKELMADWDRFGKPAGHYRNVEIADYAHRGVAFWDGRSRGTRDTIDLFHKVGKLMEVILVR